MVGGARACVAVCVLCQYRWGAARGRQGYTSKRGVAKQRQEISPSACAPLLARAAAVVFGCPLSHLRVQHREADRHRQVDPRLQEGDDLSARAGGGDDEHVLVVGRGGGWMCCGGCAGRFERGGQQAFFSACLGDRRDLGWGEREGESLLCGRVQLPGCGATTRKRRLRCVKASCPRRRDHSGRGVSARAPVLPPRHPVHERLCIDDA